MNRGAASISALGLTAAAASAQSFTEGFDGASLLPAAWSSINNSPAGPGSSPDWAQTSGSVGNWMPYSGAGYAAVGYNATVGANDISVYLISPVVSLSNGDTISFYTRTWDTVAYPDRMSVVYNTDGSTDPASFTNTLITINNDLTTTGYPTAWTQYTVTISGLTESVNGRFAFHYNPTGGGPSGSNSDRIGIDEVSYSTVPTPGSLALLGLGALISVRRRR
jgi:MYXO-CTERM domain-containing protein